MRPAGRDDGDAIRRLLAEVFPDDPKADADVMTWQYWQNPFGEAVSWVWTDGDRIVSHTARIPVPILIAGTPGVGAIAGDAATAPEYRRRGLHDTKRNAANAECCRRGIVAAFHFQAPTSQLPATSAPEAARLLHFVLPLRADWLASRLRVPRLAARALIRSRTPLRNRSSASERPDVPDEVDVLWKRVADVRPFGVVKNKAWWNWRYELHPRRPYRFFAARENGRLAGAAAVLERQVDGVPFAYVLDLLAEDSRAAAGLMDEIAGSTDAVAITFRAVGRTYGAATAAWSGMFRVPRFLEPLPLSVHVRDTCGNRPELVDSPWCVGWGEDDRL